MTAIPLTQLHSRKLMQARARTQQAIDLWRESIAVVKKAEQKSGCMIELPKQLTEGVSRAEENTKAADYIRLLSIEKNAAGNPSQHAIAIGTLRWAIEKVHQSATADYEEIQKRANAAEKRSLVLSMSNSGLLQWVIFIPFLLIGMLLYTHIMSYFGIGGYFSAALLVPYACIICIVAFLLCDLFIVPFYMIRQTNLFLPSVTNQGNE